ncbi:ATP-grasp domain-containing protein [Streptomyces sp. NPDC002055]|uniref:ATP-grasp domain-containing protein n=1 Tax=Streptomyces sp. NPDC002055 TaxID=3154534 RepID=UPI0033317351
MSQPPEVLHVGWMTRAVAALGRAGARVTCVVAPADAETARNSEARPRVLVVPDPTNTEGVLAALARNNLFTSDFAAVCSGLEFCLTSAAVISDLGGSGSAATRRTLAMRDKAVQKSRVRDAGVPTARCAVVDDLDAVPAAVNFPSVLKPLDGGGARNTFLINGPESLQTSLESAAQSGSGPWLVEEFIPGQEFQVDGLIRGGEIKVLSISRYLQNLIEVHNGGLVAHIALPPAECPDLYADTRAVVESSLKALECEDGVFHLEVFVEEGRVVFGECAARVGGGRTDDVVERAFGVGLRDEWARLVLGRPTEVVAEPVHSEGVVFGGMNLPAPQGLVRSVPTAAEVLARPGVVHAEIDTRAGAVMPDVTVASHLRAGLAVVSGADVRETEARMRGLADWFASSVTFEPTAPETADESAR